MKRWAVILIGLAACWRLHKGLTEASTFWSGSPDLVASLVWLVGTGCCLIQRYGKQTLSIIAEFLQRLSVLARRTSRVVKKWHQSWDDLFALDNLHSRQKEDSSAAIKESVFTTTRPTFPAAVVVALSVAIAVAIAALSLSLSDPRSHERDVAEYSIAKKKSDRLELPASFADRFSPPSDCGACGGPEVDMVPLPKPRPILRDVLLPRARP